MQLPEKKEIVVIKVTKVLPYGAFAELPEYNNAQGFIHISQVAPRWVKNIRNFVRPNQIRAAQVVRTDPDKQQIDLSLSKVSDTAEKARIEEWQLLKRAKKIIEVFAKQQKKQPEKVWKEISEPILKKYDNVMDAFQEILTGNPEAMQEIPKEYQKTLPELLEKSIEIPKKRVKGVISIKSQESFGIDLIKKTLKNALKTAKEFEVRISYSGGGRYIITSTANDFKTAEKGLKTVSESIKSELKKTKTETEFKKTE